MHIKHLVYSGTISFLLLTTSCNFDGVQTDDPNGENDIAVNDSTDQNSALNASDTIEIPDYTLLNDTIAGQPNDMVYQGDDGLRIEWTVKNPEKPIKLGDVVMVNYSARIAGADPYDSNDAVGEPVPLKTNVGMLIKGWEAGLLMMNVGDVGRIMIPSALGYGENGLPEVIPPGANLVVEIEIVSRIEPIVLDEGVKVYTWKINKNGAYPQKDDPITFDYFAYSTGPEGKLYDNSFKNQQPFTFKFENDNVVDGLHQGFSVVRSGENAFIEIPYELAYGRDGLADLVPKKTDIVYDVRVLNIGKENP